MRKLPAMRQSLRRTLAPVQLDYGDGAASQGLLGRRIMLDLLPGELSVSLDLTPNFHTRDKSAAGYADAAALPRNHARLRAVQIDDSLVRTRLLRAWEAAAAADTPPRLSLLLDLGPRGSFRYQVLLQLRFAGGVSLQVVRVIEAMPSLCTTMFAPCSNGRHRYGVGTVLSTITGTPCACATSASFSKSVTTSSLRASRWTIVRASHSACCTGVSAWCWPRHWAPAAPPGPRQDLASNRSRQGSALRVHF